MKEFDFDSTEFLKKEAKIFLKKSIANAFTAAERKGKITGLNSLFDFREEMEDQFIDFIEEYFRKRDQLIQQQKELINIANQLNSQAKITKLMKDKLHHANN